MARPKNPVETKINKTYSKKYAIILAIEPKN